MRLTDQRAAGGQSEIALGSLKRLDRRLLVNREDDGIFRWRHIQADDLRRLGDELRVVALAPGLAARQIDLSGAREPPDILLVNIAQRTRQPWRCPVRVSIGRRLIEHREDALLLGSTVSGRGTPMAGLVETCETSARVAHPPLRGRSGGLEKAVTRHSRQEVRIAATGIEHHPFGMARGQAHQPVLQLERAEL